MQRLVCAALGYAISCHVAEVLPKAAKACCNDVVC